MDVPLAVNERNSYPEKCTVSCLDLVIDKVHSPY